MTAAITGVLMVQIPTIARLGAAGMSGGPDLLPMPRYSVLMHSGWGVIAIAVVLVLSVVKPRGLTGWATAKTS